MVSDRRSFLGAALGGVVAAAAGAAAQQTPVSSTPTPRDWLRQDPMQYIYARRGVVFAAPFSPARQELTGVAVALVDGGMRPPGANTRVIFHGAS